MVLITVLQSAVSCLCLIAGVNNIEIWNNLALCCFYASQFDMALGCFDRALASTGSEEIADVWYNIGHVAIGELSMYTRNGIQVTV